MIMSKKMSIPYSDLWVPFNAFAPRKKPTQSNAMKNAVHTFMCHLLSSPTAGITVGCRLFGGSVYSRCYLK